MGNKFIICLLILILLPSAYAEDSSELHWTQKIFIKEKSTTEIKEKKSTKCQNLIKEDKTTIKNHKIILKDECNEKKH